MSYTLRNVLDDVASFVNQDPALATGTDLTSQANLINQTQNEWAETYQWKSLRRITSPTFTLSATSLALPANFKKMMSPIANIAIAGNGYEEIFPWQRLSKSPDAQYYYILGDDAAGKSIQINPALASGVSLVFDYQSYPSSLATLADAVTCPSRPFMASRTIAKILAARSDPRFPTFKSESDDLMANMIEEEASYSGGQQNSTTDYYTRRGFRIGDR